MTDQNITSIDEAKAQAQYAEIMEAIRQRTPHIALNLGCTETVVLISTIQLALRHPAFRERPSSKVAENICHMLIEGLASRDERIRPMLEMGFVKLGVQNEQGEGLLFADINSNAL